MAQEVEPYDEDPKEIKSSGGCITVEADL